MSDLASQHARDEDRPPRDPLPPMRGRDPFEHVETGSLGMIVFLVSLATLFAASMVGFILMIIFFSGEREVFDPETGGVRTIEAMPPLPDLPAILWISTAIILVSSGTMQWAKASIRRDRQAGLRAGLVITLVLGLAFLALQIVAWIEWSHSVGSVENESYRFAVASFYVLPMVHAAHVVGGILPMLFVTGRAFARRYSSERHAGVRHLTAYWHFLDVVWIIMYALLLILL